QPGSAPPTRYTSAAFERVACFFSTSVVLVSTNSVQLTRSPWHFVDVRRHNGAAAVTRHPPSSRPMPAREGREGRRQREQRQHVLHVERQQRRAKERQSR